MPLLFVSSENSDPCFCSLSTHQHNTSHRHAPVPHMFNISDVREKSCINPKKRRKKKEERKKGRSKKGRTRKGENEKRGEREKGERGKERRGEEKKWSVLFLFPFRFLFPFGVFLALV